MILKFSPGKLDIVQLAGKVDVVHMSRTSGHCPFPAVSAKILLCLKNTVRRAVATKQKSDIAVKNAALENTKNI